MPKFSCRCGNVINLSEMESISEWALVRDRQVGAVCSLIKSGPVDDEKFLETLYEDEIDVIWCGVCGRLHLDNGDGSYATYRKE